MQPKTFLSPYVSKCGFSSLCCPVVLVTECPGLSLSLAAMLRGLDSSIVLRESLILTFLNSMVMTGNLSINTFKCSGRFWASEMGGP